MADPRFDGCELVRQLRTGSATDWYLARQTSVRRSVVIKSLSAHLLPESPFATPLEREAQLLGQLQHENVVRLYEFKKQAERMWLVLEYVDGWTLEELLQQVKKLSVPCALAVARELVVGLRYIHQCGIVHRDLRPRNILVSRRGEVKISNFYLAEEQPMPPPPELLEGEGGFPDLSYMSPEQILGERTDARSDLFSVGVVLYEMVSGRRPFDGGDNRTSAQRVRHDAPAPLDDEVASAGPSLERILQRALAKLAADRFPDAAELLSVLEKALLGYGEMLPREFILHGLNQAGVVETRSSKVPVAIPRSVTRTMALSLWVYLGGLAVFLLGIAAIARFAPRPERVRFDGSLALPLVPKDAAYFLTVVRPWAHVFIDGQQVETTPFARPIPLSPGVHYVRFEHPNSSPVQRRIEVTAGQTLFLEVDMPLPKADPAELDEEALLRAPRTRDAGRSP